jgi:hypothetical protein
MCGLKGTQAPRRIPPRLIRFDRAYRVQLRELKGGSRSQSAVILTGYDAPTTVAARPAACIPCMVNCYYRHLHGLEATNAE